MMRTALFIAMLLLASEPALAGSYLTKQLKYPRVRAAHAKRAKAVKTTFKKAKAAWPPRGVFLRAFKDDDVVELWAATRQRDQPWVLVRTFDVCARSGVLGPKRQQGDLQVPEGFYYVNRMNPYSSYHLSMGLDYPNPVDRRRARPNHPGSDIFIHGDCVTIGCLPLEDGPIEDLYLATVFARDNGQRRVAVHVFPCRLDSKECKARLGKLRKKDPELDQFWKDLMPGYLAFQTSRVPPRVVARRNGTYQLR